MGTKGSLDWPYLDVVVSLRSPSVRSAAHGVLLTGTGYVLGTGTRSWSRVPEDRDADDRVYSLRRAGVPGQADRASCGCFYPASRRVRFAASPSCDEEENRVPSMSNSRDNNCDGRRRDRCAERKSPSLSLNRDFGGASQTGGFHSKGPVPDSPATPT